MPSRRPRRWSRKRPGRRVTTDTDTDTDIGTTAPETTALLGGSIGEPAGEPEETGPLRRCIVTRERQGKERMIRFVLGPERLIVPDIAASLPGRGIWLSARKDVLETARAQGTLAKAFARAARGPVTLPPDLTSVLQAALVRRIGDLLGLARRAGQAVAGFEKGREWVRSGRAAVAVQAADGSAAEQARFLSGARPGLAVVRPLPAEALGRVFGRDHAMHVAVAPGRLAEALVIECGRLSGLAGRDELNGSSGGEAGRTDEMNNRAGA